MKYNLYKKFIICASSAAVLLTGCADISLDKSNIDESGIEESNAEESVEESNIEVPDEDISDSSLETSSEEADDETSEEVFDEEAALKAILSKSELQRKEKTISFVDDFDGDGQKEGFFYIGDEYDGDYNEFYGEIWFANEDGYALVNNQFSYVVTDEQSVFDLYTFGDKKFIVFNMSYTTEAVGRMFYIEKSSYVETAISGVGYIFTRQTATTPNEICVSKGMYDRFVEISSDESMNGTVTGHTWKNYYFFYDEESGDFKEFGGVEISREEVNTIVGFDVCTEIEDYGGEISTIYKRGNGVVNINYSITVMYEDDDGEGYVEYRNVNYDMETGEFIVGFNEDEEPWFCSDFGGTYDAALIPEIAVFEK